MVSFSSDENESYATEMSKADRWETLDHRWNQIRRSGAYPQTRAKGVAEQTIRAVEKVPDTVDSINNEAKCTRRTKEKLLGARKALKPLTQKVAVAVAEFAFASPSVQMYGCVFARHKWPKPWESVEDPVAPLGRNLCGHPLAGLLWERQFEDVPLELGWDKVPNWECMFVHRKQGLFPSAHEDDTNMAGKKQNMAPMWKKLMKDVDLDEPTSFLDHVYLGCTQTECKPNEIIEEFKKH